MSTTNKIAEVIRKIVREEVRKEVRSVLNEGRTKPAREKPVKSGLKHALGLQDSVQRRSTKPKKQVKYTKNTMLNNILNETANEIHSSHDNAIDYETMGNQAFTSNSAQGFDRNSLAAKMGYGEVAASGTPTLNEMLPKTDTRGMSNQGKEVSDGVAKALTRDYSELVKKFKK
tara:strand:- start:560 stop:1078 length:519 start_codon:yes stop_codon:yes gene_type:complete